MYTRIVRGMTLHDMTTRKWKLALTVVDPTYCCGWLTHIWRGCTVRYVSAPQWRSFHASMVLTSFLGTIRSFIAGGKTRLPILENMFYFEMCVVFSDSRIRKRDCKTTMVSQSVDKLVQTVDKCSDLSTSSGKVSAHILRRQICSNRM